MKNFKIYFYWFLDFAFFADNFIKEDEAGVLYLTFFKQGLSKKNRVFKLKQRLELHEIIKEKKAVLNHCKRRF